MKSSDKKYKLLSLETVGIIIVLTSIIGIICLFAGKYLFGELGENIKGFLFGVFGYLSYVVLIFSSLFGILSIAGVKIKLKVPFKVSFLLFVGLYSLICITHLALTRYTGSYSSYLSKCYNIGYSNPSVGGIITALTLGLACKFINEVGAFILYSALLLLVLLVVFISISKKIQSGDKIKIKKQKSDDGINVPFNMQSSGHSDSDGLEIPFYQLKNSKFVNTNNANPKFEQNAPMTSQDAFNKLDALRKGESYQDKVMGETISSYIPESSKQSYSDGVSDSISTKQDFSYNSSYQNAFLDESMPSSKIFIPKELKEDNPYTIRGSKTYSEEKIQESSTASVFDKILKDSKNTVFENEYIKAKKEQEKIIKEANFEDFDVAEQEPIEESFANSSFSQKFTPSFSYSDPSPTEIDNSEQELQTLTFEAMRHYDFVPPPISLFKSYDASEDKEKLKEFIDSSIDKIKEVIKVMKNYDMDVKEIHHGPTFTRFDLPVPIGVPIKDLEGLAADMGLQLNANSALRIAQVPNTNMIGIEVPNRQRVQVGLKEVLSDEAFTSIEPSKCPFIIGKDVTGKSLVLELADLTHILLAGTSGSGKSVFVTSLLVSLMCKVSPRDLRIIICDPKGVDFSTFSGAPHLLIDEIVVDRPKIEKVLAWAVQEMDRRYAILQENHATKIAEYNRIMKDKDHMARILIFIDEFADLVSENGKEIMAKVQRLAQKARAAGIHLLLATQRPTVDIVSGTIKSNLSTRIALKVQNNQDSRIILEEGGAENLLVHGDMMFFSQTNSQIQRAQGPNIDGDELFDVLRFIREKNPAIFDERLKAKINTVPDNSSTGGYSVSNANDDRDMDLKIQALKTAIETKKASISYFQREFRIGFNKAALIQDWMVKEGYITVLEGKKVQINITMDQFKQKFGGA